MRKLLGRLTLALVVLLLLAMLGLYLLLRGSLARLDGTATLPGLAAPVTIARDADGSVTIDAGSEADAMRALGYVHAQERYFEMDLMRRSPAGELAALFGPAALDVDRQMRVHRLRARVRQHLDVALGTKAGVVAAYRDGVNAGLGGLSARPWAYLLLRQPPQAWRDEDSVLVGLAMYADLQDPGNQRELALARLRGALPPALYALLAHDGSSWDAPLLGPVRGDAVLPSAAAVDLRALGASASGAVALSPPLALPESGVGGPPLVLVALTPPPATRAVPLSRALRERGVGGPPLVLAALTPPPAPRAVPLSPALQERGVGGPPAAADFAPGSNNFAVDGSLTADGRAILADDMHLSLRAPNLWFRARLRYPDPAAPGGRVDVAGFTLPGLPAVIVGSNRHVAWGFTNSYIDTADFARIPAADVAAQVHTTTETIQVAGAAAVALQVRESDWGPVLHQEANGDLQALRWTAQLPGAVRLEFADMARAGDLDAALAVADRAGIPAQNLLLADRHGRIGWRLIGARPDRGPGCAPDAPDPSTLPPLRPLASAMTGPCAPWPLRSDQAPALIDPPAHRLWTANNRIVDGDTLAQVGNAGYDLGARARQIRDDLFARERFSERDLLAIQLDDRALLLERWWRLLRTVATRADTPALRELEAATRHWDGHASTTSVSYRLTREFRHRVTDALQSGLLAPAKAKLGDAYLAPRLAQFEAVAWPLLQQRPAHLLPPPYASWDAFLASTAQAMVDELSPQPGGLAARSWGERNTSAICHPIARVLPAPLKPLLCMPAQPLPGDRDMPRVQGTAFGASERMVVAPGHEKDGIIEMPGGQSGHPLSPFWGAGHNAWAEGRATPFLPGPARHTLLLTPPG